MKQPTATERAETIRRLREALALLYRPISEDERHAAARALHNEHMLPDAQERLLAA